MISPNFESFVKEYGGMSTTESKAAESAFEAGLRAGQASTALQRQALIEAQKVMRRWLVPDGIPSEKAMAELTSILDNSGLVLEQERNG